MHVEHLDRGKFVQHRPRRQSRRQVAQPAPERQVQAIGQKRNEDVRFDPMFQLVMNRAQRQVVLEVFERGFHFGQLNVKLPQLGGRFAAGDIRATPRPVSGAIHRAGVSFSATRGVVSKVL